MPRVRNCDVASESRRLLRDKAKAAKQLFRSLLRDLVYHGRLFVFFRVVPLRSVVRNRLGEGVSGVLVDARLGELALDFRRRWGEGRSRERIKFGFSLPSEV